MKHGGYWIANSKLAILYVPHVYVVWPVLTKFNRLAASHPSTKGQRPQERWIGVYTGNTRGTHCPVPSFSLIWSTLPVIGILTVVRVVKNQFCMQGPNPRLDYWGGNISDPRSLEKCYSFLVRPARKAMHIPSLHGRSGTSESGKEAKKRRKKWRAQSEPPCSLKIMSDTPTRNSIYEKR